MEVTDDEHEECNRVEQAIGKTGSHSRDCEQDDLFNAHVTLENNGEDHPLMIESESQSTSINNVETANFDTNCGTEATGDITIQNIRIFTNSSLENSRTVENTEMKTVDVLSGLDAIDNKIHFGQIFNQDNIGPIRDEENITKNGKENCMTPHTTTSYVRVNLEKDENDEYRNGIRDDESKDGCDEVDGLRKLVKQKVKTLITCASSKGMTVDEDSRPFEKANKETVDEHGDNMWVKIPLYGQEKQIKTCNTSVSEEKVSRVNVCPEESGNVASTTSTSEFTKTTTEFCEFFLPSKVDERETQSSQTGRISNTKTSGREVLPVDPYDFNRSHRGYMVIIVNQTFTREAFRDGAHKDIEYLYNIAYKLGLTVYKGKNINMSLSETLQMLEDVRSLDHSDCAMLAVAFSTHGIEQPNHMAQGKSDHALVCADDRLIFTSTITEMFNDDNCPSLKNKPKVFIIQACRGEEHDNGADLLVAKKTGIDRTSGGHADTRCQLPLDDSDVRFAKDSWSGGLDNQGQSAHLHDDHSATTGNESSALPIIPQFSPTQLVREPQLKPFPLLTHRL